MKDNRSAPSGDRAASEPERHAAAWFVSLDAGNPHSDADREFAKWIDGDIGREAEFARCEAAFCLVDRLRSDPEMRWAFEEIEPLLASDAFARRRAALRRWLSASRSCGSEQIDRVHGQ